MINKPSEIALKMIANTIEQCRLVTASQSELTSQHVINKFKRDPIVRDSIEFTQSQLKAQSEKQSALVASGRAILKVNQ